MNSAKAMAAPAVHLGMEKLVDRVCQAAAAGGLDPHWCTEVARNYVGILLMVAAAGGPVDADEEPEPCARAILLQRIDHPGAGQHSDMWHLLPTHEDAHDIAAAMAAAWLSGGA